MKPSEANRFHEAEKNLTKISHSDFSVDEDIDYLSEKKNLNNFLLSKNWDKLLETSTIHTELKNINFIFEETYKAFCRQIDAIELFAFIVDFYDLDYKKTFDKLLSKNRLILLETLESTFGHENILKTNF